MVAALTWSTLERIPLGGHLHLDSDPTPVAGIRGPGDSHRRHGRSSCSMSNRLPCGPTSSAAPVAQSGFAVHWSLSGAGLCVPPAPVRVAD